MVFRIFLLIVLFSCIYFKKKDIQISYWQKSGEIFGTTYNIIIESSISSLDTSLLENEIEKIFLKIDDAFSLYKSYSKLSKLNRNEVVNFDEIEIRLFELSQEICIKSNAYFFPYKKNVLKNLSQYGIINKENYLQICNLFSIHKEHIIKQYPFLEFDLNAIAKGYTVDLIKELLQKYSISSYLIEIGGEICLGNSPKKNPKGWMVALEFYESNPLLKKIEKTLYLKNICLASSGNYLESHIFNPFNDKELKRKKRVTVFGPHCAICDAYATLIYASNKKYLYSREYSVDISEE